jgi:guanine nucleotide-binding protein alpha-1 subunit
MPTVDIDPLTRAMQPPKNETPEQKAVRLQAEAEATRISQLIDQQLKQERAQIKKEAENTHKILLLGEFGDAALTRARDRGLPS